MILSLLLIATIATYCIDVSGGWHGISSAITKVLTKGAIDKPFELKPFSCSKCMTFWSSIVYLVATNQVTLVSLACACAVSYLTTNIAQLFDLVNALITKLYNYVINRIER